jgi:hypothetical protein
LDEHTVARNRYFNQYTKVAREQSVLEDLIIEAIKIYGVQGYFLPRTFVGKDILYGEDPASIFDDAIEMEMYIKSYDGFMGQEDFLSKFGLQIDESITFTVSQKRFSQSLKQCLTTEYSYNFLLEDGSLLLQEPTYDYSSIIRPREGDLVWIPMLGYMYEIKFTENIDVFFPLGNLYSFEIRCDRFEYSSERLDTGVEEIDTLEENYSLSNEFIAKILLEDVDSVLLEDSYKILSEGDHVVAKEVEADNEYISEKIRQTEIVDFTEKNPFSEVWEY